MWSEEVGFGEAYRRNLGSGSSRRLSLDLTDSARRSYIMTLGGGGEGKERGDFSVVATAEWVA